MKNNHNNFNNNINILLPSYRFLSKTIKQFLLVFAKLSIYTIFFILSSIKMSKKRGEKSKWN